MPFALDAIRKLGGRRHEVFACDSYDASPGSHSRYLAGHFTTASPSGDPEQFAADVERIARENWIELVLPMFETLLVPAGRQEQLDFAVLAQLFQQPLREPPRTIHDLAKVHGTDRGCATRCPSSTPSSRWRASSGSASASASSSSRRCRTGSPGMASRSRGCRPTTLAYLEELTGNARSA